MFAALVASFGFAISLPILNVDAFIVEQNIRRGDIPSQSETSVSRQGDVEVDTQYFVELSDDAVPPLVKAFQTETLPDSVREKVGVALACINYERGNNDRDSSWQSFHFSSFNADKALTSISNDLKEYQITRDNFPATAITPSGEEIPCATYYYD